MERATRLTLLAAAMLTVSLALACSMAYTEKGVNSEGPICFDVKPKDAYVEVDGTLVGQAKDFTSSEGCLLIERGRHEIKISKEGYTPYTKEVYVGSGEQDMKVVLVKEE